MKINQNINDLMIIFKNCKINIFLVFVSFICLPNESIAQKKQYKITVEVALPNGKLEASKSDVGRWTKRYFSSLLKELDDEREDTFIGIDLESDKIFYAQIQELGEFNNKKEELKPILHSLLKSSNEINTILLFSIIGDDKSGYEFKPSIISNNIKYRDWSIQPSLLSDLSVLNDKLRFKEWLESTMRPKIEKELFQFIEISKKKILKNEKDSDNDGIPDSVDDCPYAEKQIYIPHKHNLVNGCLDSDNDNIPDKDDLCPNDYGEIEFCGCSHDTSPFKYSELKTSKCFRNSKVSCLTYHKGLIYAGSEEGTVFILDQLVDGRLVKPKNIKERYTRFYGFNDVIRKLDVKSNKLAIETQNITKKIKINANVINYLQNISEDNIENKIELVPNSHDQYLLSPKKDTLALITKNGTLFVKTSGCTPSLKLPSIKVSKLFFITNKNLLFIQYSNNSLYIYKKHPKILKWQKVELKWEENEQTYTAFEISPDGQYIYIGHEGGLISLFTLYK